MSYVDQAPEGTKFDFLNMDVKLYLALKGIIGHAENESESLYDLAKQAPAEDSDQIRLEAEHAGKRVETARLALAEFELSCGPLPDWAISRNWGYELVPGAQLCTKDGRRIGNAHIIFETVPPTQADPVYYHCLTDAGSKFVFTEQELKTAFTVGDWISDPARIVRDFDRNKEFQQNV